MEKYIDDTDVYILDLGLHIYQYNGQGSNKDERVRVSYQHKTKLFLKFKRHIQNAVYIKCKCFNNIISTSETRYLMFVCVYV